MRERLEEPTPGCESLAALVARPRRIGLDAGERLKLALDPTGLVGLGDEPADRLPELLDGVLGRVRLEDSRLRLDHLRERPEGHAVAVRERAAVPPEHEAELTGFDRLEELEHEPALADARNSDKGEELRLELTRHSREHLPQQRQLAFASDERRSSGSFDADPSPSSQGFTGRHRARLPLRRDRLDPPVVDRALCGAIRCLVDEDRAGLGRRLKSRRGVDDVSRGHSFAGLRPRVERNQRFPGRDPDPHLELALLDELIADRERRAYRPLGIVLVRDRGAKDRHDRIADQLLDGAAVPLELGAKPGMVGLEQPAHVLRVHALGTGGEADEVAEEAGDDLALFARSRFGRQP